MILWFYVLVFAIRSKCRWESHTNCLDRTGHMVVSRCFVCAQLYQSILGMGKSLTWFVPEIGSQMQYTFGTNIWVRGGFLSARIRPKESWISFFFCSSRRGGSNLVHQKEAAFLRLLRQKNGFQWSKIKLPPRPAACEGAKQNASLCTIAWACRRVAEALCNTTSCLLCYKTALFARQQGPVSLDRSKVGQPCPSLWVFSRWIWKTGQSLSGQEGNRFGEICQSLRVNVQECREILLQNFF